LNPDPLPEDLDRSIRADFARGGLMRDIGAEITGLAAGRCTLEIPFSDRVAQQQGFFHGGIIGALADTAGGYASLTVLPQGTEALTLEYKINFLRPAVGLRLIAEGSVLRAGRSVIVTRVDVHCDDGAQRRLCAAMQQSIMRG